MRCYLPKANTQAGSAQIAGAYVANQASNDISVIDTTTLTVLTTIMVDSAPSSLAVSSDGLHLFVANLGSGTVSVVDTVSNTVTATVVLGGSPSSVAIRPSSGPQ